MAIGGFGTTMRKWVMGRDGVKRWADNGQPCDPNCDRSACGDHSPGKCDNPDCPALTPNAAAKPPSGSEVGS